MNNVTEKTTIVDGVEIDADGVIVQDDKQLITGKVGDFFAENESDILSQGIIEIRTDCKEAKFKIGKDGFFAERIEATFIASREIKDIVLFSLPDVKEWAQVLFIDHKRNNVKSTLIKTASLSELRLLQSIYAEKTGKKSLFGCGIEMYFSKYTCKKGEVAYLKFKFLDAQALEPDVIKSRQEQALLVANAMKSNQLHIPDSFLRNHQQVGV